MGVKLQSSSGGSVEIAAPVTASNYVLTAPATNGTILNDASSLAAAMLTGNVDVARLVSAFSGSNVSLAASGYQKLPSGLIIQWSYGSITATGSGGFGGFVNFPIAFPTACRSVMMSMTGNTAAYSMFLPLNRISTGVVPYVYASGAGNFTYDLLAIGY